MSYVYFVQDKGCSLIKIGFASDPFKRISEMASDNPHGLVALGVIEVEGRANALEHYLHGMFRRLCVGAEWHRPDESLLAYIREHAKPLPSRGRNYRPMFTNRCGDCAMPVLGWKKDIIPTCIYCRAEKKAS